MISSSRADHVHTSAPAPVVLAVVHTPSPTQVTQPSPDSAVEGMEMSPSNFVLEY